MRIVDEGARSGTDLIQVAYVESIEEAGLMVSVLRDQGIKCLTNRIDMNGLRVRPDHLVSNPRGIYVRPGDADRARRLLDEVVVEDPAAEPLEVEDAAEAPREAEAPEPVYAEDLVEAGGHGLREHGAGGAYARLGLILLVILGVVLVAFLLTHS